MNDKHKVLDVKIKIPNRKLIKELNQKKYQVDIEYPDGRVRFMYGDDPVVLEMFAKAQGLTILKVTKL